MGQTTFNHLVSGLPAEYQSKDWKPPSEPPCIIKHLCDRHEGLEIEAKVIKEHWWKPHIKKLFEKKVTDCFNLSTNFQQESCTDCNSSLKFSDRQVWTNSIESE